ncbi:hypothetical protein HDU77_005525 [Chytriomyces hyalinus]|nr:hypothetical protein HDU77_005525 [Chytriomyces hyalinus]
MDAQPPSPQPQPQQPQPTTPLPVTDAADATAARKDVTSQELRSIVIAACVGTLIEWYDFFVFGSMTSTTSALFYNTGTEVGNTIAWLAAFAVGFIVRPFGAIVFGYIGDKVGRKYTFALTLVMMGVCTFLCGCLPTIKDIGPAAGILLIILRLVQGLAIGGEYGGAASYISEYCPERERGFWTGFLQMTATGGLILSLIVILIFRVSLGEANWSQFGWRFPFLLSVLLVGVSLYIRLKMRESPLFAKAKGEGKMNKNPLVESFLRPYNLYYVCLALFGATMGQGVVWYTAQFYTLTFIQSTLKTPLIDSYLIVLVACFFAAPLFVVVGSLSDKYGRKRFMLAGIFLGATLFYPMYMGLYHFRPYENNDGKGGFREGYNPAMMSFLTFLMVSFVALAYGPIAAFMVELFPTSIRYTSMSLPYHIGNGIFGGLVPVIATSVAAATGNKLSGLFYPIGIASACFVIGLVFLPETNTRNIENMTDAGGHMENNVEVVEKA